MAVWIELLFLCVFLLFLSATGRRQAAGAAGPGLRGPAGGLQQGAGAVPPEAAFRNVDFVLAGVPEK